MEPGPHKNVPSEAQGERYSDGEWQTNGYVDWSKDQKWAAIPFHDHCFKLLEQARKLRGATNKIDLDVLYAALCSKREGGRSSSLDFQYFEFNDASNEQYWIARSGWEARL